MLFRTFIFIICLSPLFFGTNRPWSWSLYSLLISSIGLVFFIRVLMNKEPFYSTLKSLKYPFGFILIPIIWAILQATPGLPSVWSHPFWALTAQQLSTDITSYISVSPIDTRTAVMKLLSYLLVFFLSFQFSRQSKNARITFNSVAYIGFVYALYGLVVFFADYNELFWFDQSEYKGNVRSTFINRNSYATYAGLCILSCIPLLLDKVKHCLVYGLNSYFGWQYFIENLFLRAWFPLVMLITLCSALLLSHSRGGFLSTLLAIIFSILFALFSGKLKSNKVLLALFMSLIIGISFVSSSDKLLQRMDKISLNSDKNDRLQVYAILESAIADNFWLGTGYGTFEKSFKLYRDETIKGYYTAAHNTYLENLFELGVLPACALFIAILWIAALCFLGVLSRHKYWQYPMIGCTATVLVGVHALVDFSLQIPAVAYTFALLLGTSCAQSLPAQQRLPSIR